jgi:uncharacterized protein YqgC (DUF456 family)
LAGIVVPVLPGLLLVWAGVAVWSFSQHDPLAWTVFALATLVIAAGALVKYLIPGRRLRDAGVPWRTLLVGAILGIVGFFVIPLVGLPLGFVLGVYLSELVRLGSQAEAWPSTRRALAAVGLSILIELGVALLATAIWMTGVVLD